MGAGEAVAVVENEKATTEKTASNAAPLGGYLAGPMVDVESPPRETKGLEEKSLVDFDEPLGTFAEESTSSADVTKDEARMIESWEFVLNSKRPFEQKPCGCLLPRWKNIEWRDMENGHRFLYIAGQGLSVNGKPTKRRRYGHYFTHDAVVSFVRGEYESQVEQFQPKRSTGVKSLSDHRLRKSGK